MHSDAIATSIVLEQGKTLAGSSHALVFSRNLNLTLVTRRTRRRAERPASRGICMRNYVYAHGRQDRGEQGYGHGDPTPATWSLRQVGIFILHCREKRTYAPEHSIAPFNFPA